MEDRVWQILNSSKAQDHLLHFREAAYVELLPELLVQLLGLLKLAFVVQSNGMNYSRKRNQWLDKECK